MENIKYTRIRLIEVEPNIYESKYNYVSARTGGQYKVIVDLEKMEYKIRNVKSYIIIKSSKKSNKKPVKTKRSLYRRIKKDLISLGVKFKYDMRGL